MSSCISAIGTANPENKIDQTDIFQFMANAFALNDINRSRLKSIYDHAGINYRYSVIPDFGYTNPDDFSFFEKNAGLEPFIPTEKRMQVYQQQAINVAVESVKDCLKGRSEDIYQQVTHLITVSCTGMYAPGLDIDLVERLALNRHTERTCITFMGCYGAVNALKTADYICRANANAKVLIVSVELCTLHFQKHNTLDNWVANSLFSDGAAAVLVESNAQAGSIAMESFYTEFLPEARNEMGWYVGNTGFEMRLTSRVSKQIKNYIKPITHRLLKHAGLDIGKIGAYAIHPGGKKILEAVEHALELPEESNTYAYEVLREYGNMSSATILFVLKRMMQSGDFSGKRILSFAFGPGLTVEGMVLQMH
ncbi:type III polyketide synthase [Mucilaginibacter sp. KACC 22063]|uniref:type III polyketide synthase n=1 Tax=Mucilaginibacter sp. KACC 22063 TaxID=3025666 RepID=UPI002365EC27|nr:type III polyketide synthase [Mucilaginibacter sp. KACC 22063]WDF55031.1 type III polyketide synthase [Mucilaginibacter sp. KACC 22063]